MVDHVRIKMTGPAGCYLLYRYACLFILCASRSVCISPSITARFKSSLTSPTVFSMIEVFPEPGELTMFIENIPLSLSISLFSCAISSFLERISSCIRISCISYSASMETMSSSLPVVLVTATPSHLGQGWSKYSMQNSSLHSTHFPIRGTSSMSSTAPSMEVPFTHASKQNRRACGSTAVNSPTLILSLLSRPTPFFAMCSLTISIMLKVIDISCMGRFLPDIDPESLKLLCHHIRYVGKHFSNNV